MKRLELNGIWKMKEEHGEQEYPAKVPGSVLLTLLDAGAIEDPYYRRNEYKTKELFRKNYVFYREFEADSEFLREENIELVCEGLDTLADIYINDNKVFYADNMHRTWRVPVKKWLKAGRNRIRIIFYSVLNYIDEYRYRENRQILYVPCGAVKGNQLVRKAHSMFGWDWGPQLIDAGIFRKIYLEGSTRRRIREIKIHQEISEARAELLVKVDFSGENPCGEVQCVRVTVSKKGGTEILGETEGIIRGGFSWEGKLLIPDPELWWPNGYGEQPLYELKVLLLNDNGSVAGEEIRTIGIRTLTVSREADKWGKEFAFTVNGVKIFAMGANYIPEDCIYPRITAERQEYLLECARRAHFNCIRVWGGGYYPSDEFYEICDRKGLIVWQDLMFACNVYDASDSFLDNIRHEAEDNVRRLRSHPCLGLWCGNNEIESGWSHWPDFQKETEYLRADYIRMFEHVLPGIMNKEDPDTFFWPSSPSAGGCFADPDNENDGDSHYWDVWHGQKPFTDYRNYYFRFCSEFGFQSFPCGKTIETFTERADRNVFSRVMESHQKNNAANGRILYYMAENFRYPGDFESLLYVSQVLQGMAIQYGVEHWRREAPNRFLSWSLEKSFADMRKESLKRRYLSRLL